MDKMDFREKYMHIETELKAPKNLYNSFGKYKYRNAEGICEAVKPLLDRYKCTLTLADSAIEVGGRVYVKAECSLRDCESDTGISNTAIAREASEKKGMDESQITGTASSYARKYALNGLFLLDDTKDADTNEYHEETTGDVPEDKKLTQSEIKALTAMCTNKGYDPKEVFPNGIENLTSEQYVEAAKNLAKVKTKNDNTRNA